MHVRPPMRSARCALGAALAIALAAGTVSCGGSSPTTTHARRASARATSWVVAVSRQNDRFVTDFRQLDARLRRRDFAGAGAVVRGMGKDGRTIRARFGQVPSNEVDNAAKIYRGLRTAGDAAIALDLLWERDPPPYAGSAGTKVRKGGKISDAAVTFNNALVKLERDMQPPTGG